MGDAEHPQVKPQAPNTGGRVINVLIGHVDLTRAPHRLASVLGSCIALVVFDQQQTLAGMAHVLLPDSRGATDGPVGKYADRALPALVAALVEHGGRRAALAARIAGGARMFTRVAAGGTNDVGSNNIAAVRDGLARLGIPLRGEDVGGVRGRKVLFDPASGTLRVQTLDLHHQSAG